jgi:hypothetical protein
VLRGDPARLKSCAARFPPPPQGQFFSEFWNRQTDGFGARSKVIVDRLLLVPGELSVIVVDRRKAWRHSWAAGR